MNLLRSLISVATDVLIWLSTWGDSSRMTRALKAVRQG
jgi:ubiquinone biosynthesis monooxygenase Coq7